MDDKNMELPEGLGFSMAMNTEAMKNFSNMSQEQKEQVIQKSKQVETKAGMRQLINQLAKDSFQG